MMETKAITAHVPLPLAEKVDILACRLERAKAWIIKHALAALVDQEEDRHRLTLEAMVDFDNNDVINHKSVKLGLKALIQIRYYQFFVNDNKMDK
jgi:predicted transcriptional regulator